MKKQMILILLECIFYIIINKIFSIPNRIILITFLIYFVINIVRSTQFFEENLFWEEIKQQLKISVEFMLIIVINSVFFLNNKYVIDYFFIVIIFFLLKIFLKKFIQNKNMIRNILIIGTDKEAVKVSKFIGKDNNIVGYILIKGEKIEVESNKILGEYEDLKTIIKSKNIVEVIITSRKIEDKKIDKIMDILREKVEKIKFTPYISNIFTFNTKTENYDGILMISVKMKNIEGIRKVIKRTLDIVLAIFGCFFLVPLSIYVYIKTDKQERKNGIFFTQDRIGLNGEKIKIYKFRSMVMNAEEILKDIISKDEKIREEYQKNKKLKNDPRITKIGTFLRRTSLDEFPQFLNILKGEMSFVGPRPYLYEEKKDMGKYYEKIVKIKPGITGMWQVNGRSDIEFIERLKLDEYYYRNWSLWLDIIIIIKTIKIIITRKGAY